MSRFLMSIRYLGTNYHGWQVQNNARTIQPSVQDALEKVIGFRPNVSGCSRTDSGVHAYEYCFHFDYDGSISPVNLVNAINANLDEDIVATACNEVDEDFHARYSVKSKEYVYVFYDSKFKDPFLNGRAVHARKLDEKLMDKAAKEFVGKFDFSAFCSSGSSVEDKTRTVFSARVIRENGTVRFFVRADGFLYNMVRIMAGTLLFVCMGKIRVEDIPKIIHSKDRSRAGITAPACGLYLNKVFY